MGPPPRSTSQPASLPQVRHPCGPLMNTVTLRRLVALVGATVSPDVAGPSWRSTARFPGAPASASTLGPMRTRTTPRVLPNGPPASPTSGVWLPATSLAGAALASIPAILEVGGMGIEDVKQAAPRRLLNWLN